MALVQAEQEGDCSLRNSGKMGDRKGATLRPRSGGGTRHFRVGAARERLWGQQGTLHLLHLPSPQFHPLLLLCPQHSADWLTSPDFSSHPCSTCVPSPHLPLLRSPGSPWRASQRSFSSLPSPTSPGALTSLGPWPRPPCGVGRVLLTPAGSRCPCGPTCGLT